MFLEFFGNVPKNIWPVSIRNHALENRRMTGTGERPDIQLVH
jgi:hypothetical protein